MHYAGASSHGRGDSLGIVFEMKQGMVNRGCELSWLSQYPFEREILFAPLTALEVVHTRVQNEVLVLEIVPTINQTAETIEAVIYRMQLSHVQYLDLLLSDFESRGAPPDALTPLSALRAHHLPAKEPHVHLRSP